MGDGTFQDRTGDIQSPVSSGSKGGGAIFGDYDNDGDLDIFATTRSSEGRNMLFRNDRGIFRDVTATAGITDTMISDNAIWLDYDRDGDLDLYRGNCCSETYRNTLHRNNGDGTFTDATGKPV